LLDAGGVLVFPQPGHVLPPLREAGFDPDLATLERAHYRAMAIQDAEALPPVRESWWRNYLLGYVAACTWETACATTWPAPTRQVCSRSTWTRTGSARPPTATRTSAAWPS